MLIRNPKYVLIKYVDDVVSEVHVRDEVEHVYRILFFAKYTEREYSGIFEDGQDFTILYDRPPMEQSMTSLRTAITIP